MLFLKMLSLMIFCFVWFVQMFLIHCDENSTVIRVSVPEEHHLCLPCGDFDASNVVWTHGGRKVPVNPQGDSETREDVHHRLLSHGDLCLLQLDDSDSGKYHCNQQLVAELQVLTGHDFQVSAGWTLLLPCSRSSKPKQRWFQLQTGGRREAIFTRFKNGTVHPERGGSRLSFRNNALQILNLQPEDAGEYQCNGKVLGQVTILPVPPELTSFQSPTSTTASAAETETDMVEKEKEKEKPENALLLAAVVGLGLMILLLAAVCVLLTSIKCTRKKSKYAAVKTHDDPELQPWTTTTRQTECEVFESLSVPEETIHYASLGRHNWRERPSRTPLDSNVIYSSVVTRPAAHRHTNTQRAAPSQ
uniref:uncharacterized protein LOC109952469 isoform X1 n=2 Tax=Monopterus albus TaxID=43700 RepID=UPI0009B3EEF1|nr:uncharacterized protein LOC109952469 isoform X1 [Monopterus albus]